MNDIGHHRGGSSPAADRVWAQVCGLRPSVIGKHSSLILQAYLDDSQSGPDGEYALAGALSDPTSWAEFSKDWEQLLKSHGIHKGGGQYHFKMSEMASLDERMERVPAFWQVIKSHVKILVSCRVNITQLHSAQRRIYSPDFQSQWERPFTNSFMFLFYFLLANVHERREVFEPYLSLDAKIDFYFDEQSEKKAILSSWDNYMQGMPPKWRVRYGNTPRFERDEEFLPLQAADFWAWWIRKWSEEGSDVAGRRVPFENGDRRVLCMDLGWESEQELMEALADWIRRNHPYAACIYDLHTGELIPFVDGFPITNTTGS